MAIDGQQNQAKQNDVIEDLITQGIEVLFLNPVDSESVQPALEACAEAGVKVINVDSAVAASFKPQNTSISGFAVKMSSAFCKTTSIVEIDFLSIILQFD